MEMLPCFMHYFHPCFFALFSSSRLIHLFGGLDKPKISIPPPLAEESVELCFQQGNYNARRKWTKNFFWRQQHFLEVSDCWQPHMFCCRGKKGRLSSLLFRANPNSHMWSNTSNFPGKKKRKYVKNGTVSAFGKLPGQLRQKLSEANGEKEGRTGQNCAQQQISRSLEKEIKSQKNSF